MKYLHNNFTLLFLMVVTTFFMTMQIEPMGKQLGITPQMSPEQLQELEKELAEANKMINEYVSTLSPEEQAEFNRAVDEVTHMFENMDEEELNKFMGDLFTEEAPAEALAPISPEPAKAPQEEEEVPVIEQGKIGGMLAVLNDIIKQSNDFIVKVQSSPELPARIERWGKEKDIIGWQADTTWFSFKARIESLVQKLQKVKEQDPKTKAYKYLSDLIEDEALYNNLSQLQTNLAKTAHLIEIPVFAIEKLSKKSKKAVRDTVSHFIEGFDTLKIPQALDKLFEKFEPKAKKIREAEELAEKQAIEAGKRPRVPARAVEAGVAFEGGYGGVDRGYSPSYGGRESYRPSIDYSTPSYERRTPRDTYDTEEDEDKGPSSQPRQPTRSSPVEATKDAEKERLDELARTAQLAEVPKDAEADRRLVEIKLKVEEIVKEISENPLLQKLDEHLVSADPVDEPLSNILLPRIHKKINEAKDSVKALQRRLAKFTDKVCTYYAKELKTTVDQLKEPLVKLASTIEKVDVTKVSLEKQYVYLGDDEALGKMKIDANLKARAEELEQKDKPLSLNVVKKSIDDFLGEVEAFAKKKEEQAKQPIKK